MSEIDGLAGFQKLRHLSLIEVFILQHPQNPVSKIKHYRLYTIHTVPGLRVLDFTRIKDKERAAAAKVFGKGAAPLREGEAEARTFDDAREKAEAIRVLRERIGKAKTLDEISRLERQLEDGVE
jgi:U2 small nuclear ribonucleoprotein A'